jgi:hypothetical protein
LVNKQANVTHVVLRTIALGCAVRQNGQPQKITYRGPVTAGRVSVEIGFIPRLESNEIITKDLQTLIDYAEIKWGRIEKRNA